MTPKTRPVVLGEVGIRGQDGKVLVGLGIPRRGEVPRENVGSVVVLVVADGHRVVSYLAQEAQFRAVSLGREPAERRLTEEVAPAQKEGFLALPLLLFAYLLYRRREAREATDGRVLGSRRVLGVVVDCGGVRNQRGVFVVGV
jgi:hypothetical protein